MIGKFLFFLFAATATFLGLSAGAVTTSQNIDIIVTHGAPLTTFTFVNKTGNTLPAGSPVSFGQAFRYGDIMPGTYPLIRDAATHVALPGQQWDEISTWRENGGNGSWRHAVWAAWLPKALAPCATYQIEFVAAAGTYSQSSHQALGALCSGPAAHDLKIHLTDVRNLDDTLRDSGDATFRVCDNIANVGRDAPRHLRAGNVYDEYQVNGMFVYATSGHRDPMLYAQAIIDIFTKSDGVSAGDVRWDIHVHNSWMNVSAGSTGNAGNPGPAGFANDPQMISYRYEVDDGATKVLDQGNLDATIASASNPISPAGTAACHSTAVQGPGESACMFVASSLGANAWPDGQAMRVSSAGTPVAGLINGSLYYVWPSSEATLAAPNTQYVSLMESPLVGQTPWPMTNAQGSGTTTFSARVAHYNKETWDTLDPSGQLNWAPFGTTSRVTRKVYPVFTAAELRYWEETGLMLPIYLSQGTPTVPVPWGLGGGLNYSPVGKGNVIGGAAGGPHPDLGVVNEYSPTAIINETEYDWDNARLFTYGSMAHGDATLLNEATGRIPPANNGPPTGPGGNGNGGSYAELGAPHNQVLWGPGGPVDMASSHGKLNPFGAPIGGAYTGGYYCCGGGATGGTDLDHMPSFNGFTYLVFGERQFLDFMYWHANRDFLDQQVGPGPELGQGYYRVNNAVFLGDGHTYHYWGLLTACCQTRGSIWLIRDVAYAATFGGDSNIERSYFNDLLTETSNYWPLFLKFKDGPVGTGYSASILPPNDPIDGSADLTTFQVSYIEGASYILQTFLHNPMAGVWNTKLQRYTEGVMGSQLPGMGAGPGLIPSYYVGVYDAQPHIHNGDYGWLSGGSSQRGNIGPGLNGTDASDFAVIIEYMGVLTGGQLQMSKNIGCGTCPGGTPITAGDTLKSINPWAAYPTGGSNLDQLNGSVWYDIIGPIDNVDGNDKFYLKCPIGHPVDATCPTPGAAFTGFTRGGVPVTNEFGIETVKWRPQYDAGPGHGYSDDNYAPWIGQLVNGLHILGYNVAHAMADFAVRANPAAAHYNPTLPSLWWDPTIVVPGLPAPVNSIP